VAPPSGCTVAPVPGARTKIGNGEGFAGAPALAHSQGAAVQRVALVAQDSGLLLDNGPYLILN